MLKPSNERTVNRLHRLPAANVERFLNALMVVGAFAFVTGCTHHYGGATNTDPYGFLFGIWHGMIFPFALLASIVSWTLAFAGIDILLDVQIIGRPNTGFFFYYLGFLLGLSVYSGVGSQHSRPDSGAYGA